MTGEAEKTGTLILRPGNSLKLEDWQHYSLSRFEEGRFNPLFIRAGMKKKKAAEPQKSAPVAAEEKSFYRSKKDRAEEEKKKQFVKKLETQIAECEKREEEINGLLARPDVASDYTQVSVLVEELEGIKLQIDSLYKQYETVL